MGRRKCFIEGCNSREYESKEKITFHNIKVSDPLLYKYWITAITFGNNQQNVCSHPKTAVICSKHFTDDSFLKGFSTKLKSNAVPSIFPASMDMENLEFIIPDLESGTDPINQDMNTMEIVPSTSAITEGHSTSDLMITPVQKSRIQLLDDDDKLEAVSPRILIKYIRILKQDGQKYKKAVKRLHTENSRQKMKIKKLNDLISGYLKTSSINKDTEDFLQVK